MRNLVIVGAGGFGREMFATAREAFGFGESFRVKGFLDVNPCALDDFGNYPPVIGSPESYVIEDGDVFVTALGNVETRKRCAEMIEARGGRFIPIVHRSASIGPNVAVGDGAFIAHNAVLTADVKVGRHSCVFHGSVIGHDTSLGDFSHVYSLVSIGGGVSIGERTCIFPGARIVPRVSIGNGSIVGIGSVVVRSVEPRVTVFGVPAQRLETL